MSQWTLELGPLYDMGVCAVLERDGGMQHESAIRYQKDAEAISRLQVHSLISDSVAETARKRLVKRIRVALGA